MAKNKVINFDFNSDIVCKWRNGGKVMGTLQIEAQAECYDNDLSVISTTITKVSYNGMDITAVYSTYEFGDIQEEAETKAEGLFKSEGAVIRFPETHLLPASALIDNLFEAIWNITKDYRDNLLANDQYNINPE